MIKTVYPEKLLMDWLLHRQYGHRFEQANASDADKEFFNQHPYPFYSPSFFIRIGLFLLVLIISGMVLGLLLLITGVSSNEGVGVLCLMVAIATLLTNEKTTRRKLHFASGMDDGLQFAGYLLSLSFVGLVFNLSFGLIALVSAGISFIMAFRYLNSFMAMVFIASLWYAFYNAVSNFLYIPVFWIIATALGVVVYLFMLHRGKKLPAYCADILLAARYALCGVIAACSGYLGLRYAMFVPDANVFYWLYLSLMFIVPLKMLVLGIIYRLREMIHVGILALYVGVYELFNQMGEHGGGWWMLVTGVFTLIVASWAIRFLRVPRKGITDERMPEYPAANVAEWLFFLQSGGKQTTPAGNGFGGGDFGGGGASGQY